METFPPVRSLQDESDEEISHAIISYYDSSTSGVAPLPTKKSLSDSAYVDNSRGYVEKLCQVKL
jgi:hypothetical protein